MAKRKLFPAGLVLLVLPFLVPVARAQGTYTQTFELRPGWNAIYLEVQPEPSEIGAVIGNLPIASVWTYDARFGGKVAGIVDPAKGLIDSTGWYGFFPAGRAEAALTNLFRLRVNRAYLVKLEGTLPAVWSVTGRPSLQRTRWEADSFNLTGFPVDPQNPPSFGSWFEPSPAHSGQAVYRLDPSGIWQPVLPYFEPIRSGEAYWVWTRGVSEYQGPMEVTSDLTDGVEFGSTRERSTLTVRNLHDLNATVTLTPESSATPVHLRVQVVDPETSELVWQPLPEPYALGAPAHERLMLTLSPSRAGVTGDRAEQVLSVRDGLGSRRLVPVGVSPLGAETSSPTAMGATRTMTDELCGLWIGSATVDKVTETATGRTFELRLLVHVDSQGQARLLKQVIQLSKEASYEPDPDNPGYNRIADPAKLVLITDDAQIPSYKGVWPLDGVSVGARISTAAYDFPVGEHGLPMTGSLSTGLTVDLTMSPTLPTHPFRHQYHPDHDNADNPPGFDEVPTLKRTITLTPVVCTCSGTTTACTQDSSCPTGKLCGLALISAGSEQTTPCGPDTVGGTYGETILNLRYAPIAVGGTFLLQRATKTCVLNQESTP